MLKTNPNVASWSVTALLLIAGVAQALATPAPAMAATATPAVTAVGRMAAPLLVDVDEPGSPIDPAQQQVATVPPEVLDPEGGAVFSIIGGSVWSGSSAFQGGAALAYFFGPKAAVGFEVEADVVFGPGGRVSQVMGSFIWQLGARTSKFVPYFAVGGGYLRVKTEFPSQTQEVLDSFGIDPQPQDETALFTQLGGGVKFYLKPSISFRADARFAQVPLNLEIDTGFFDSLFAMRRFAGMLSIDF